MPSRHWRATAVGWDTSPLSFLRGKKFLEHGARRPAGPCEWLSSFARYAHVRPFNFLGVRRFGVYCYSRHWGTRCLASRFIVSHRALGARHPGSILFLGVRAYRDVVTGDFRFSLGGRRAVIDPWNRLPGLTGHLCSSRGLALLGCLGSGTSTVD